jgi:O-antigen/teichoic acid export membrane protein
MARPRLSLASAKALLGSRAVHSFSVVGVSAAAAFLSTVILARIAGASVVGDFALAMTTANLLTGFVLLGLDRILVREVAGDLRTGKPGRARSALVAFARVVALMSILTALAYLALLWFTPFFRRLEADMTALALAGAAIAIWPLLRLGRATLRAQGSAVLSQFFQEGPSILKTLVFAGLWIAGIAPTAGQVTFIWVVLLLGCALVVWWIAWRTARQWPADGAPVERALLLAGLPMMTVLFLQAFSQWFVLAKLALHVPSADVGAFRVAAQVAGVVATVTMATEFYVAPRMAGDFRAGRTDLAWRRHRRGTLAMIALAAPVLLVAFAFPTPFLTLAFGPEFAAGATALSIIAIGQLVNVLRGPLGALLSMSGNDRIQLWLTLGGLALVLGLGFTLIPRYGITGAAIAYTAPFLFRSLAGAWLARRAIPSRGLTPAEPRREEEEP